MATSRSSEEEATQEPKGFTGITSADFGGHFGGHIGGHMNRVDVLIELFELSAVLLCDWFFATSPSMRKSGRRDRY